MKISEIFGSIDGEGLRTGELATFIRTFGCNLHCSYCFGIRPGRNVPKVHLVKSLKADRTSSFGGKAKKEHCQIPLNSVCVGDEIFTFDDKLNIVTTKVTKVHTRNVTEWYEIKFGDTMYFVTPEHPIFTTSGIKKASELKVGDMVLHTNSDDLSAIRMKLFNPMFDLETLQKVSNRKDYAAIGKKIASSIQEKKRNGTYKSSWELLTVEQKKELCEKISQSKLREKNPNWIDNYAYRNYSDLKSAIKENPENFNCECCETSGKETRLFVHHLDGNHENDNIENLSVVCSNCHNKIHQRGYNFWTANRKDGKVSLGALVKANGIQVTYVNRVDITKNKFYGRKYGPKPLTVYNLTCYPYNTYFLDTMWVHNCDSLYAVDGQCFNEMSVGRILNEVERIGYKNVTFTGGEPLMAENAELLVDSLIAQGYDVNIETNGAYDFTPYLNKECILCVDYKTPFSKMNKLMLEDKFELLREGDVVKFVMAKSDFDCVREFLRSHKIKAWVYFSPVFGEIEPCELVEFTKELNQNGLIDQKHTRVQVQLHKILWEPTKRGV